MKARKPLNQSGKTTSFVTSLKKCVILGDKKNFAQIMDYDFTAQMEEDLDKI